VTRLLAANGAIAASAVAVWLGLLALETHAGRADWIDALYLASVAAVSGGYWWVNRALARRFAAPETGVIALGALAAVLTAATVVAGALASMAVRGMWTGRRPRRAGNLQPGVQSDSLRRQAGSRGSR